MRFIQAATLICALVCSSCATHQLGTLPAEVTGTLHNSVYLNWALNWCRDGKPVYDLFNSPEFDCAQTGGEIYRVELRNIRSTNGARIRGTIPILIARHAFNTRKAGTDPWYIVIDTAPTEIATATKTHYCARYYEIDGTECASITIEEQKCFRKDVAHSWVQDEP